MRARFAPLLLGVAMVGAACFALLRGSSESQSRTVLPPAQTPAPLAAEPFEQPLPPNHPAIHPGGISSALPSASEGTPALAWSAPVAWHVEANASPIRLATYRVSGSPKQTTSAELTVTRAGGTTDENIERWIGQFDDAGQDVRVQRIVAGLRVTTLEVSGTYDGGMSGTGPGNASRGWALLGAVVETKGPFYFFKMVGPADAVHAARPQFELLMESVRSPS